MTELSAGIDRWLAERETTDRDLEAHELEALADALAERPELWRDLESTPPISATTCDWAVITTWSCG